MDISLYVVLRATGISRWNYYSNKYLHKFVYKKKLCSGRCKSYVKESGINEFYNFADKLKTPPCKIKKGKSQARIDEIHESNRVKVGAILRKTRLSSEDFHKSEQLRRALSRLEDKAQLDRCIKQEDISRFQEAANKYINKNYTSLIQALLDCDVSPVHQKQSFSIQLKRFVTKKLLDGRVRCVIPNSKINSFNMAVETIKDERFLNKKKPLWKAQ